LMNKANTLNELGEKREAIVLFDSCLAVYDRLIQTKDDPGLAVGQAKVWMNKANVLCELGEFIIAVKFYDKAVESFGKLVFQNSPRSHGDYALAKANRALALSKQGFNDKASKDVREAASLLREQIARNQDPDLQRILDWMLRAFRSAR
jgi:tetratricopeptide (TPR) repeat protein